MFAESLGVMIACTGFLRRHASDSMPQHTSLDGGTTRLRDTCTPPAAREEPDRASASSGVKGRAYFMQEPGHHQKLESLRRIAEVTLSACMQDGG